MVLDSWWWTERPSETCRVLFQNKINLSYWASRRFYYRNILQCTVLQTSNVVCQSTGWYIDTVLKLELVLFLAWLFQADLICYYPEQCCVKLTDFSDNRFDVFCIGLDSHDFFWVCKLILKGVKCSSVCRFAQHYNFQECNSRVKQGLAEPLLSPPSSSLQP
jgi:hypothetical protein